jgi:CheY-like chemotaxis protein
MHQRKILLLENVATQAAGVREHLSQAGYQVAVSRYEADGLKRLVEWGPEVVLVSTAHPAGDFVEYCRRARALAPAVRIIVTSALSRDRLFQEHPELPAIVDGVLLRPYSREEVAAMLAPAAGAACVPAAAPAIGPDNAALRAEFQRQLDARFLEVEEL